MAIPVTELEAVTLGCVATLGPCTAYKLRQRFQASPSACFSGSAGSIYPLLERVEERGLVASRAADTGRRKALEYTITRSGRAALRAWLKSSLDAREVAADDPLRTRMLFLEELPAAARLAWLDDAEQAVRDHLALVDEFEGGGAQTLGAELANDNARRLGRARLAWLAEARARWSEA
ncbi:MAG: helix-turn-helix transcriptional regulator [Planctomycetota bacterium]